MLFSSALFLDSHGFTFRNEIWVISVSPAFPLRQLCSLDFSYYVRRKAEWLFLVGLIRRQEAEIRRQLRIFLGQRLLGLPWHHLFQRLKTCPLVPLCVHGSHLSLHLFELGKMIYLVCSFKDVYKLTNYCSFFLNIRNGNKDNKRFSNSKVKKIKNCLKDNLAIFSLSNKNELQLCIKL